MRDRAPRALAAGIGFGVDRALAAKNMQLMTEGEILQFHRGPAAQSAGNQ